MHNLSEQITRWALESPYKRAVVMPAGSDIAGKTKYSHYTFIELEKKINQFANVLCSDGVIKGDKVLLFIKPCLDFSALTFAIFKIGAIPVFIDPGMGRESFLRAIQTVQPKVLIGLPKVLLLRAIFYKSFSSIKVQYSYSKFSLPKANSIIQKAKKCSYSFEPVKMSSSDLGAILFTSGGTGIPKGVEYTHEIFIAQTNMLKDAFNLNSDDIDIPGFPLFSMFTLSLGMTSCIPSMDAAKPSKANPKKLYQNIMDQGASFVAGSPAIWTKLAHYCYENKLSLPSVKYLVMFGAPITNELHFIFSKILPNGTTYTPYGATECLPIANLKGSYILEQTASLSDDGAGTCVGLPLEGVEVKIIEPSGHPIGSINDIRLKSCGEIGEIIVSSPTTTKAYFNMKDKTESAKILDGFKVWHRMGDMGYLDKNGMLWFCGRQSHVVKTSAECFYTIPCEAIFNQHKSVNKSAIIQYHDSCALVIEMSKSNKLSFGKLKDELLAIGKQFEHTKNIKTFFLYNKFPVDVRHNIKIDRLKLRDYFHNKEA